MEKNEAEVPADRIVSIAEAMLILDSSQKFIYDRMKTGELDFIRRGRTKYIILPAGVRREVPPTIAPQPVLRLDDARALFREVAEGAARALAAQNDVHADHLQRIAAHLDSMRSFGDGLAAISAALARGEAERGLADRLAAAERAVGRLEAEKAALELALREAEGRRWWRRLVGLPGWHGARRIRRASELHSPPPRG